MVRRIVMLTFNLRQPFIVDLVSAYASFGSLRLRARQSAQQVARVVRGGPGVSDVLVLYSLLLNLHRWVQNPAGWH